MTIKYLDSKRLSGVATDRTATHNRGTITTDGSYTVIKFTSDGTFTPTSAFDVEYLVIGGGGGAGGISSAGGVGSGGGGAGGLKSGTNHGVTAQFYTITVGGNGSGSTATNIGTQTSGGNSSFDTVSVTGGGYACGYSSPTPADNGGSGGGGAATSATGGTGIVGQGYDGGDGSNSSPNYAGGGGGGSSSIGIDATGSTGGNGGNGTVSDILVSGSNVTYAGGGGGGFIFAGGTGGSGGTGGGGNAGSTWSSSGSNATNYGSGGGGSSGTGTGGDGYGGLVIIRFLTSGNTYETSTSDMPTDIQDNSIFVETDTARRYWFSEALAPTFEDDFTSDNWTDSDSTIIGVNTSTQVLDFKAKDGNFYEVSYIPQTIGDKFVYRMKFNLSTIDQTGNVESVRVGFGLSNAGDIAFTSARDEVGITMRVSSTYNKFYAFTADGAQIPYGGTDFSLTPATSTDYYLEIIGNEGTYTFNIYSDEYSTLIESESITDAGLVLDKLVVRATTSATTNNQVQGTIDDVKFYNGVTSVTPATWTGNIDLTGLKSYYNFEQTSTTLTNMATSVGSTDSLGSSGDATGSGTITKGATGIVGNAWDFGGGKVTTSHQFLPTSGDYTYSTWVSLDDISTAGEEILRHESPTFEVWRNSGGLNVSGASGTINLETASNLANNIWYNIVLVHSSSGDISYLNGVSKSTADITSVPTGTTWYLGGRSGSGEAINGKIDETTVWSRALSSSEVSSLYNSGRGKIVY